jgi:hypothetical protein
VRKTNAWSAWYNDLYRSLGDRALQPDQPGERVPELILHNIERQSSATQPLLVTMPLSCGQTRRHARALRRLSRRFEQYINTVVIYVKEADPIDVPSPWGYG